MRKPIVQSMFPQGRWQDVLKLGGTFKLAVDANLAWKLGVEGTALSQLAAQGVPTADLHTDNTLQAYIIVPDFSFAWGRAEIAASGEGSAACAWKLTKTELKERQTGLFVVVFKVPTGTTEVTLTGTVAAEASFRWVTPHLERVFSELHQRFQDILSGKKALPLGDHQRWTLTLPRSSSAD